MNKVYLLLRNNKQNGPYDLDELLQFNLKPDDLIWIEGRSAGWYYPQEIEAVKPHLSFAQPTGSTPAHPQTITPSLSEVKPALTPASKKIFVSMPVRPTEVSQPRYTAPRMEPPIETTARYAEPVTPAAKPTSIPEEKEALHTGYSRSLEEVEAEYTSWVYRSKSNKKTFAIPKKAMAAALLTAVAGFAAWQGLKDDGTSVVESSVAPSISSAQPEAVNSKSLPVSQAYIDDQLIVNKTKPSSAQPIASSKQSTPLVIVSKSATIVQEPAYEPQMPPQEEPSLPKEEPQLSAAEPAVATETPKAEKKKLKEKISDIFRKKKEESTGSEPRPSEEEAGERRAARREADADLSTQVAVKFEVPNEWMMGIKGAKAVVTNRSNQTLTKAMIEVTYYNADGDVLQTKTFSVGNLSPKKSVAVSIPDHATAEKVDYRIISAVGTEPLASR